MCDSAYLTKVYLAALNGRLGLDSMVTADGAAILTEWQGLRYVVHLDVNRPQDLHVTLGYARSEEDAELEPLAVRAANDRLVGPRLRLREDGILAEWRMYAAPRDAVPVVDHLVAVVPDMFRELLGAFRELSEQLKLAGIAAATLAAAGSEESAA